MLSNSSLRGLLTAVEELGEFSVMYEKHQTPENRMRIRFGEMSVIQMALSLYDKAHNTKSTSDGVLAATQQLVPNGGNDEIR